MKHPFYFLAVLLSAHYLLAKTPSDFDEGTEKNKRGNYSNIDTYSRAIDRLGDSNIVPTLSNDVTVSQYCDFLNAVAVDAPLHLANNLQAADYRLLQQGGGEGEKQNPILRTGSTGNYHYEVVPGCENFPISNVSWCDQARYCNWLENGQPTGLQGPETTEDGSYTLSEAMDHMVPCNEGSTYFLPSQEGKDVQTNLLNPSTLQTVNQSQSDSNPLLKSSTGFCVAISVTPQLMMDPSLESEGKAIEKLIVGEIKPAKANHPETITSVENSAITSSPHTTSVSASSSQHQNAISIVPPAIEEKEQNKTTKAIHKMAERTSSSLTKRYKKADDGWLQLQQAWEKRTTTQREADNKREILLRAQEHFQRASEALANTEINETVLGRISEYTARGANVLFSLPGVVAQGSAGVIGTVSTVAGVINQIWTHADVNIAEAAKVLAELDAKKTSDNAVATKDILPQVKIDANKQEELLQVAETTATTALAKALKPSSSHTVWTEEEWKAWAEKIVAITGDSRDEIDRLAHLGMTHPSWAAKETAASWEKRVHLSEKTLQEQESQKDVILKPLAKALEKANTAAFTAREEAVKAKDRLDNGIKLQAQAKKRLLEINDALDLIEKTPTNPEVLEQKREALCKAFADLQQRSNDFKNFESSLAQSSALLDTQDAKALELLKTYTLAKDTHLRIIARTKAHAEADRAAWEDIWPEHNLINVIWKLPSKIFSAHKSLFSNHPEEVVDRNLETIEPPLIPKEELVAHGKKLLREAQKKISLAYEEVKKTSQTTPVKNTINDAAENKVTSSEESTNADINDVQENQMGIAEELNSLKSSDLEEIAVAEIRAEAMKETEANKERWTVGKQTLQLKAKAYKLASMPNDASENVQRRGSMASDANPNAQPKRRDSIASIQSFMGKGEPPRKDSTVSLTHKELLNLPSTLNNLDDVDEAAGTKEEEWKELINLAEEARVKAGGIPLDSDLALETWMKADQELFNTQKENRRIEKERDLNNRLKETWSKYTTRWAARREADRLAFLVKKMEEEKTTAQLIANAPTTPLRNQPQARENATKAKEAFQNVTKAYKDAEQTWSDLADEHRSIKELNSLQDPAILQAAKKAAREKLKQADKAVNDLWEVIESKYKEDTGDELGDPDERTPQASNAYMNWYTKCQTDYKSCFKETDEALIKAQTKYYSSNDANTRAQAQLLYQQADLLEESILVNYSEIAKHGALEAARKRITQEEVENAYKLIQNEHAQKISEITINGKMPSETWADDTERTRKRTSAVTTATQKAIEAFQAEEERLAYIKKRWIASIKEEKRDSKLKRERAAKSYAEGDVSSWYELTAEEREAYNKAVIKADEVYENVAPEKVRTAQSNLREANRQLGKINSSRMNWNYQKQKQTALTEIKKAEEKLTKVQKEQKEHAEEIEKAIRWAKLTYEDREAEIAEKQAQTAREKLQIAKKTAKQTAKNSKEPLSWIYVAFCFDGASSSWKHASEELTKGNQKIATLWIKVAEQKKSLAEQHKQAAYAYASDNTEALMRWDEANNKDGPLWSATHCLSDAISSLEKAAKANEEGKEELAKLYTQKAGCIQAAAEAYQKSAHAVVQGNEEEAERLKESANYNDSGKACLSKAIPSLEKATKMNVERKEEFAKLYNQQVKCYQAAAEAYQKIAQAVVQGNKEEAYFLRRAVRLFESDSTLSPGSVYCLSKAVSSLEEATKANAEGKIDIAKLYNQQVGCYQAEAEVHQKTAHALLQGNKEEAERLENSIGFLQLDSAFVSIILECLKRASEKNSSGNLELAQLWTKEIEKIKELAKHMSEIAQTHVQTNGIGNIQDIYGDRAIAALGRNAERLFEAAEYLIKATEAKNVGNPEIAELWDKNALAMKALAEHAREAIQAYMSGNTEATEGWDKAASLFWNSGDMSHETDAWIPKIAEAKEQGNLEVAELWKKGVEQIQALAEQWRQVAYDHALVNKKVTKQWDKIVLSAKEEDDYIGNKLFSKAHGWIAKINEWMPKIVEAKEQGNLEVASLWTKGVEQMLASAKEYQKALQVLVQGDEEEVENLKEEVELLDGDHSKKSTKVNEEWKSEIAKLHIQQAECYHTLAEEYSHVINVITQGEKEESQRLKEALKFLENDFYKDPRNYLACFSRLSSVYCLSEAASSLEKAIKANEEGKSKVAKLYTQQVKCYQAAAETSQKAAHAVVEWNEEEAERLGKVARIFGSCDARSPGSSYYLSKAISSSEKGDTAQMEGNSEIASLYTQQVDCYHALAEEIKKFAHAAVEGAEEEEAQCLEKQVDFFKSNARLLSKSSEYLVKSSEANNFGNLELAQLWAKEAKKIKELAKYMSEIVQAHVKIDELENIRDHRVGATLENHEYRLSNAAEYLTKAVEAKTSENPEIAELWDKNALAMKSLAEHAQEAIQAYMSGNTEAVEGWDKAASFFNKSVDNSHRAGAWIPKIAEAKAQGNLEVAALWTKIVEQLQSFAEQYRQAACAHASNNKKEAEQWDEIFADEDVYNKFLSNINEWTAKETEAKEQGYLETAALWAKAVEQMLVSFEQQIKQINTITKDTEESDKKIFLMITYSISSQAAECLANEAKAEAQGDQEIASLWSTASKQIQAFAEPHRQAVYAYASNNKKEAEQWDEIFADEDVYNKVFSEVKEWIRKIEEAKTQGHLEIAELWTKAVGQKMTSLKEYQKALQTLVQGNKEGAKRLMEERKLFDGNYESPGSSYCLSEAASCLEQAVKAQVEGKEKTATFYTQAKELYQNAAEECKKAVYTTVQENEVRAEQYKQTAYFFNKSASSISGAAICLEKVAHVNKEEISYNELWIQKAECHQITAGYYQQAAKAVTQGNHQEGRFLEKAAKLIEGYRRGGYQCLSEAADCLENSDIGEIEGKEKIVTLYTQAKELYQNAAEEYKKAANIMAQGNEEEAQRLDQIAYFIQNSASSISEEASCLKTAANARTGWERESTEFWIQKAECYQISARYYQQAAKAVIQGHDEEGERLEKAAKLIGGGYYSNPGAIEYLSGAIKYDERIKEWFVRKNPTSVVFWTKACEQMKISAEEHRQAALASVEGNTEEVARREEDADSLKWRAERLADAAEYLNKATETGRSNHEKDTDLLNKAILAIETSAEEWRQAQKEDNMVNEATTQASSALSAETAWTEVSLLNVVHLWDEVLKKVRLSEVAWTRAVETCQEKKEQAPEQLKSWWNTEFEKAANSKNHSTCNLPWVEARKLESMANAAGVKVHIAAVGEGEQKPTEASLNQEVQLWEEAITKAQDVEAAWAKCIERYSKICSQTPERLKTNWIDAIEVAKERCAFWHAKIETWNKAKEAEIAAFSARKKALSLTTATTVTPNNSVSSEVDEESKKVMSEEVTQRWNEAIHKAREIETIYANAIKTNQKSYEEASQNYKAWWNAELKIAEDAKACWTAKVAAWEAESNMFNQTCDKTKQLESIVHADQSNITPSALLEGEKTSTKASLKIVADQFLEEITARAEEMKDYWAAKNSWKIESR